MKTYGYAMGLILVGGFLIAPGALPGLAADYYVAPAGNDGNPGTEAAPFRTVQKACDTARAGDRVLLREGVYAEKNVDMRYSGEEGKPIVLQNYSGERPIVEGRIELQALAGWQKPIGWITIEGLEIRNAWDGIKFYNAHHLVLRHNNIHDNNSQGILGNGYQVRIEGNVIARNGLRTDNPTSNQEHGIYCTGTYFAIVNNVIHSNRAYGIQVAGYDYQKENHPGPEFAGARHWLISHNTIAFNQNRAAIVVWQSEATECVIQNNILYRNAVKLDAGATNGIDFISGGGHVVRHNLWFAPDRTPMTDGYGKAYTASDNGEKDPQFVDPEHFDFHLQKDSPAIDAGTAEDDVDVDIDGTRRPQGRGPDLGAYEFKGRYGY